jgi:hypothetical protein
MTQVVQARSLYERDILLWAEETAAKLRARDFGSLDLENLIDEVESLGISQRKELLSRLTTLLEHLLKRMYVLLPIDYNGWERTIRNQRKELKLLLYQVPSLKTRWDETFGAAWKFALLEVRAEVKQEYQSSNFPNNWQYRSDIETILNTGFWETVTPSP